jgi:hypothetical protein
MKERFAAMTHTRTRAEWEEHLDGTDEIAPRCASVAVA